MDIKDYWNLIKKNALVIIVLTLVFGAVAAYFTNRQKTVYQSSSTVEITRFQTQKQSQVGYFQYDNYYNTQVSVNLSDNVAGWLSSPAVVSSIFTRAGYDQPKGSLKDLGKIFTVKKTVDVSSVINISYSSDNAKQSEDLIKTAVETVKDRIKEYNSADSSGNFEVYASSPVIVKASKAIALNTIIAAIIGLFVSFSYATVKESLKK